MVNGFRISCAAPAANCPSVASLSERYIFLVRSLRIRYIISTTGQRAGRIKTMEDYVKAAILENEDEARLMESILNEREIPHMMRSYYDTAFDGLYQAQKGWGHVSTPASYKAEVMEIISDLRKEND